MKFYTYLYLDPKDGTPRYVGKGKVDRAFYHLTRNSKSRLRSMCVARREQGMTVEPIIQYEVDEQTALEMEKFWIAFYGRADLGTGTLFNLTDGGEGVSGCRFTMPAEAIAKISAAHKGKVISEEHKQQLRELYLGTVRPQSVKDKISASTKGRAKSEETKQKISTAVNSKPRSEKQIAALAALNERRKNGIKEILS